MNKKELEELSEKSDIVDNFKEDVIKANEDKLVVEWISKEEEQKQYEEVMYEKGLNQGLSEGLIQGKQQGLEEGFTQGKELGFTQGKELGFTQGKELGFTQGIEQNKQENAKKMLELKMDLETISKVTDLTIEEIKSLKN